VAVIYISHRLEEVKRIGDRVTVLRDGRKIGTREVAEVDIPSLVSMMVGRDLVLTELQRAATPGPEVLRVEGLSQTGVLHDISFRLHQGEIVGLAGLVGSGRTELARAIFGVDRFTSGQLLIDGKPARVSNPSAAAKLGIGFVTEDRLHSGLAMALSVGHNSTLPSLRQFEVFNLPLLNLNRERAASQAYVRNLNVQTPSLNQKVRFLSGGNQQKVVLAKWLMARSRILILDEPTQGIDVGAKEEVHRLMVDFTRDRGGAVLLISSDLPEILRMSDRLLVMHRGRIAGELDRSAATEERVMHLAVGSVGGVRSDDG
jgi:ribose transport system ATP-binding protein